MLKRRSVLLSSILFLTFLFTSSIVTIQATDGRLVYRGIAKGTGKAGLKDVPPIPNVPCEGIVVFAGQAEFETTYILKSIKACGKLSVKWTTVIEDYYKLFATLQTGEETWGYATSAQLVMGKLAFMGTYSVNGQAEKTSGTAYVTLDLRLDYTCIRTQIVDADLGINLVFTWKPEGTQLFKILLEQK